MKKNAIKVIENNVPSIVNEAMEFFNPQKIETVDDATVFLSNMTRLNEGASLRFYRTIHDVYVRGLYQDATYMSTKAKTGKVDLHCNSIVEYCAHCVTPPIGKTQTYNAIAAGEFITPDGSGTVFDGDKGTYTFTQLLEIVKSGKGVVYTQDKASGEISFVMVQAWERATNADGSKAYKEDKWGKPCSYYRQTAGEMRLIDAMLLMNAITPQKSVREISKILKSDFQLTEFGVEVFERKSGEVTETESEAADKETDSNFTKVTLTEDEWIRVAYLVKENGDEVLYNKLVDFYRQIKDTE